MKFEFEFTRKELNFLLKLRKKTRTWDYLKNIAKTDDNNMNIMFSHMHSLFYVLDGKPITVGEIKLNHVGETIAQAEYDRRFDMYLTRITALLGLTVSIAAIVISLAI